MPGGLDVGALDFLCFGWAMMPVAVAAARGTTYFFGGMAAGLEASGREIGGRKEENGREVGEKREETAGRGARFADRADPRAFFASTGSPSTPPRAPGSTWVRRNQFWPEPAINGLLGARLGRFFAAGAAKTPGEGLLGARLEMLLLLFLN